MKLEPKWHLKWMLTAGSGEKPAPKKCSTVQSGKPPSGMSRRGERIEQIFLSPKRWIIAADGQTWKRRSKRQPSNRD